MHTLRLPAVVPNVSCGLGMILLLTLSCGEKTIVDLPSDTTVEASSPTACLSDPDCAHMNAPELCDLWRCDSETQVCVQQAKPYGAPCGNPGDCVLGVCIEGTCNTETLVSCDDGNPCTDDSCGDDLQCQHSFNELPCDPEHPCATTGQCQEGLCIRADYICDPCTVTGNECVELSAEDACVGAFVCNSDNQECDRVPDSKVVCLTDNPCGSVVCDPGTGLCVEQPRPNGSTCSDHNLCSLNDRCVDGQCMGDSLVCGQSEFSCQSANCDPGSGCVVANLSGIPCSDGSPCSTEDVCTNGVCQGVLSEECSCGQDMDCQIYDDGNPCSGTLRCADGACAVAPETVIQCPTPGGPCQQNACDPNTGQCKVAWIPGNACSDGDPCTAQDQCGAEGVCQGVPIPNCGETCPDTTTKECEPGDSQNCGLGGEQFCDSNCAWGTCQNEGECSNGSTQPCGNCGTQSCQNNAWSDCQNEGVCAAGTNQDCGNGGKQFCTDACGWSECLGQGPCTNEDVQPCGQCGTQTCVGNDWAKCTDEGPCKPLQTKSTSCGNCGTKTKTCNDQCQWDAFGGCENQKSCTPEATENQACGNCGTQTRTCSDQCAWGGYGSCDGQGACTPNAEQSCGNGGKQTCTSSCQWGSCAGEGCKAGNTLPCGQCGIMICDSNNQWGSCGSQGACSPGATETQGCGLCGTMTRVCGNNCQWEAFGSCQGEGVCNAGQKDQTSCGNCGSKEKTCTEQCQWGSWGTCGGQGPCVAGSTDSTACGNCGSKTKTCTAQCQWGSWGTCGSQGPCVAGNTQSQPCGNCGTQSRTCTGQCQWGGWGSCTGEKQCSPGSTKSCGNCGTTTCNTSCGWGSCGGQGECAAGAQDSQGCGNCGSQTRTCNNSCSWGGWGSCGGEGPCAPGAIGYADSVGCTPCQQKTCSSQCEWSGSCSLTPESECELYKEEVCGFAQGFKICVPNSAGNLHCKWTECIEIDFN